MTDNDSQYLHQRYKIAASLLSDIICEYDTRTGTATVIGPADRLLGHDIGAFPPTLEGWMGIIHPEDLPKVARAVQQALVTGEVLSLTYRVRLSGGGERVWASRARPVEFEDGRPVMWLGVVTDVTEQLQADERLREAEFRYRTVADFTFDWEVWQEPDGELRYVSPSCARISGYAAEKFIADPALMERILEPEDRPRWVEHRERELERGISGGIRFRIRRRDGELRWIEHSCQPVMDEQRQFLGTRSSYRDVTENVRAEEEAQRAREELAHMQRVSTAGELTATLAHEINQPLAGILSNAQAALHFLDGPDPDLAEVREALEDIVDDDRRARAVLERVRDFLRKEERPTDTVDINATIQEVASLLRGQMTGGRATLELLLEREPTTVEGDRVLLQQVLMNLLLNAIEAQEDERLPWLSVETRRVDDRVVQVRISDSGPGIPPDVAERMFEPFFSTKPEGLGMGLSITRSIVEDHRGRIWLEPRLEQGSTLCIELPLAGRSSDG